MTEERFVAIEGVNYPVLISDEYQALQAALAAGRAVVELMGSGPMSGAPFAVERLEEADGDYLERVVRRALNMPWIIGETRRLMIREFCMEDIKSVRKEPEDTEDDRIFYTADKLEAYIKNQYGFYQYGIWALVEKCSGTLVGMAGLTDKNGEEWEGETVRLELGYHIFEPYRRNGYGIEACQKILDYADENICRKIWAEIESGNLASISLIKKLGFKFVSQRYSEEGRCSFLYARN